MPHDPEKWVPVFRKDHAPLKHDPENWVPVFRRDHAPLKQGPMVEKRITCSQNVVDLAAFREKNGGAKVGPMALRLCRHCGAVLADGEREEECSSTFNVEAAKLRWQAAQILRGIVSAEA
jgi:hypothetical protein